MFPVRTCPIPDDEPQRLRAVRAYEVLDTEPELEFDALTRVAAHTFATPIALVAIMDRDRLWFKSKLGLDVPQLDRKIAFCAHAIMRPTEALIIEDLRADHRFVDNPLVVGEPHIRFYAGAPIVESGHHALGTIAVVDAQPRTFSAAQRSALIDLSTLVMTALQARRRALDLERLAMTDHLTGVASRAKCEVAIERELRQSSQSEDAFAVILMDLNGFKYVNDTFGHAAGDTVLCEVARRLSTLVRHGETLARLGGDEFALIVRNGDARTVASLAARISNVVQRPIILSDGNTVRVGISVGSASYTSTVSSAQALLGQADEALYRAKQRTAR
jgi:diguanylate cyclase (GGDEF)-like protein